MIVSFQTNIGLRDLTNDFWSKKKIDCMENFSGENLILEICQKMVHITKIFT